MSSNAGGRGCWVSVNESSCAQWSPNKLWRSNSKFNLCSPVWKRHLLQVTPSRKGILFILCTDDSVLRYQILVTQQTEYWSQTVTHFQINYCLILHLHRGWVLMGHLGEDKIRWFKGWMCCTQSCESRRQTISLISRPTFRKIWKVSSLSRSLPLLGKKVSPRSRPLFGFSRPNPVENESLIANR